MTGAGVFVLRDPATLVPMQAASFASEDDFQRLLAAFPALLGGDQIDTDIPRRFVVVSREQAIGAEEGGPGRWSLDHLFLDQEGIPTLVEVKRGTDTRIRREVVGQMLDYAANSIVYWPVDELRQCFETRCEAEGEDAGAVLTTLLGSDEQVEGFWSRGQANLRAGRIRMLFVADRIPTELRRIVEFLNGQMQPAEVLAVELRQYEGQGLKMLVPIVIGQTQEAVQKKSAATGLRAKRSWDETAILSAVTERDGPTVGREVARIMDWARRHADQIYVNDNPSWGSIGPLFERGGRPFYPFLIGTYASISIYFQYMVGRPVFDAIEKCREFMQRLNEVPGFALKESSLSKRPVVRLDVFSRPEVTDAFLGVMDWFVAELPPRGSPTGPANNHSN